MTWTKAPLGDLLSYIGKGVAPKYTDDSSAADSVMVLGQKCVRNQSVIYAEARFHDEAAKSFKPEKVVCPGDILVNATGVGSAGRVAQVVDAPSRKCITDGHVITLRSSDRIDPVYLGYFVKSKQVLIEQMAEGSTGQTEMNRTRLQNEILVTFPESNEDQKAIAKFGLAIDRKIATNAKLNGYLEELCDALFLDFLEQADSSWHEGTLEELAEVKYGKDHKKLADGPYPVYGSGGFMRSAEKSLFSGESVLIPRKGSLNNVMYVNEAFWTVDTLFFTVPRIPGAAKFLYQYVKRLNLASMNSGSAVPSMTTSILNALSLPVPPRDSLLSFNAKLQSMYDAVRANNLENRRLESLRDSLLPKLMTGEIDVSKIDLTQLNSHLA